MLLGVRLMNSLGLSGVAFSGMDIGGFTGNGSPPYTPAGSSWGVYTVLPQSYRY